MSIGKVFKGDPSSLGPMGFEDSLGKALGWQVLVGLLFGLRGFAEAALILFQP